MTWGNIFTAAYRPYELSKALIEKLGGTEQGGAVLKEPSHGWASEEFGNIMSTSRIYSNVNGTLEVLRPTTSNPGMSSSKSGMSSKTRTAIIASTTTVGLLLIACIFGLLYYKRTRRNSTSGTTIEHGPYFEVEEKAKYELSPNEKQVYELTGETYMHEATDGVVRVEADRANIVTSAAELPANIVTSAVELPATNFSENGRWGVPLIKVPTASIKGDDAKGEKSECTVSEKNKEDIV
jgi:hypothetical protein